MHPTLELLERAGVIADEDALRIYKFDEKQTLRLHEDLYNLVFEQQQATATIESSNIDEFNFMAGASLRGHSTCSSLPCQLRRFDFLGRYTALYAEIVVLPLPLSHPEKVEDVNESRKQLFPTLLALARLRPLIDAGLIRPVVMRTTHCVHMKKWTDKMTRYIHEVANDAAAQLQKEFRLAYVPPEKSDNSEPTVYIEGPEDFLEHGSSVLLLPDAADWKPRKGKPNRKGEVEIRGARKIAAVRWVLNYIANDTTFYLSYGRPKNLRYLSDRPGETFFLDLLNEDDEVATSSQAMNAYLTHSVPLLGELPISTLLRIRREERDSFIRYRAALNQALRELLSKKKRIGKKEIRDLYAETIQPELLKMRSELYQEQRRKRRRLIAGLGSLATSVALGAFAGVVPVLVKGALAATGAVVGGRLLGKQLEAACEHGATLKEKNDFYFLLRLTEEAEES